MFRDHSVTFAILSCRRTHLLAGVISLFRRNCFDHDLIDHWVIIDDSHDPAHHKVVSGFDDFEVVIKPPATRGHARSLNMLLDRCRTGYLVYWEDDAVLPLHGTWISQAIEILQGNRNLLQVTFDKDLFTAPWHQDNPQVGLRHFPFPHRVYTCPPDAMFPPVDDFTFYIDDWPGFTLRPHVLDLSRFHARVGRRFDEAQRQNFEYDMALAVRAVGLLSAGFEDCDICDVGGLDSSYAANGEARDFETAGGLYSARHIDRLRQICNRRDRLGGPEAHFRAACRWMRSDQDRQAAMQRRGTALLQHVRRQSFPEC